MSEQDTILEPGETGIETGSGSTSLLDRIKQRRDARDDFLVIGIPSWNDELRARYQVLDRDEIDRMVRRIRARVAGAQNGSRTATGSNADIDFLIKACVGVIAHDNETEEEAEIAVGFDMNLARLLGEEQQDGSVLMQLDDKGTTMLVHNEKELVSYLIKGNTIALATHSQKVARWMQDTSRPVEDPQ
jgi:hypothetical protein